MRHASTKTSKDLRLDFSKLCNKLCLGYKFGSCWKKTVDERYFRELSETNYWVNRGPGWKNASVTRREGGRGVSQTISYFDTSPKSIAAIKRFGHGHPRQTGRTSDCIYQPVSVQKYPKKWTQCTKIPPRINKVYKNNPQEYTFGPINTELLLLF